MMVKITIVVPVYNAEETIKRCLDSILNQTFTEFLVVIVNDGSTDKTKDILNDYNDKRIIIINQENEGAGFARNKALEIIKTKYVTFIDADDYVDKDYLKQLYENIKKADADIACCNRIDDKEKIQIFNREEALKNLLCLKEKYGVCIGAKLFKYSLIKNIRFDDNHFEDIKFILTCFLNSKKVVYNQKKIILL